MRSEAYGERRALTPVDHFGVWLSGRAVKRRAVFAGKRVADFGCGYQASFSRSILPQVAQLLLVDVHLADDLRSHPKVHAIDGRIEVVLPTIASRSLDVIMCLSVLEHLDNPQTVLDDFQRVLSPDGIALINVPSWRGKAWLELSAFRLGLSPVLEIDDHKRYYDPRDLWPMLVGAGFHPKDILCKSTSSGSTRSPSAVRMRQTPPNEREVLVEAGRLPASDRTSHPGACGSLATFSGFLRLDSSDLGAIESPRGAAGPVQPPGHGATAFSPRGRSCTGWLDTSFQPLQPRTQPSLPWGQNRFERP